MTLETLEKAILILTGVGGLVAGVAAAFKKLSVGNIVRWTVATVLVCGLLGVAILVVVSLQPKEAEKEKEVVNERKPRPPEPEAKGGLDKEQRDVSPPKQDTAQDKHPVEGADATVSLRKHFAGLPKTLVAVVGKPAAKDYDEATGRLRLDVVLRVDKDKYDAFVKTALPLLDKLSV